MLYCLRVLQFSHNALLNYLQSSLKGSTVIYETGTSPVLELLPTGFFFKAFSVNRCFLFELVDAPGCGSQIINPQWEMFLSVQVFPCSAADSHQRCKCSVSRLRVIWSRALAPSFEAGLFCVEPTLARHMNAFVLESLPAAALLIFYTSTDWSRDQLRFHPPFPYSWEVSIHPCGLPSL